MFEFIEKFHSTHTIQKSSFSGEQLITALSKNLISIFDIRSTSLLFQIPTSQQIQEYYMSENTLYYSTKAHTVVLDITTKEQIYRTIAGSLIVVDPVLYIITPTTLFMYLNKILKQIQVFDHGIFASCVSYDKKSIGISSNKIYVYDTETQKCTNLDISIKILAISSNYLVGKNSKKDKILIYQIQSQKLVHELKDEAFVKMQIVENHLYYLTEHQLNIIPLSGNTSILTIKLESAPSDFLIHKTTVYVLCNLQLYGYSLEQNKQLKENEQVKQLEPNSKEPSQSLIFDNLENSFQISDDFQIKGIINNLLSEHQKFIFNLNHRNKAVSVIYKWYSAGNIKATMFALQRQDDTSIIFDCLKFIRDSLQNIPDEQIPLLIRLGGKLVSSKYSSHVNFGIQFINLALRIVTSSTNSLKAIKNQLISVKQSQRVQKILKMKVAQQRRQLYEDVYQMCFKIDKILKLQI